MATPTIEWKTNPFNGDFNPGTKTGQQIFIKKSKGPADGTRFELTKDNASKIHQFFKAWASTLGNCISIPIEYAADGSVSKLANLIHQHSKILLADVQRRAHKRFSTIIAPGDPIPNAPFVSSDIDPAANNAHKAVFYDRVNAAVLSKLIENTLSPVSYQDLLLHQDSFSFIDATTGEIHFDGPTMLKIILTQIDPDTIVGMDTLKAQLETMKLHKFGNDVGKMLTRMMSIYQTLKENGHEPDSWRRYLYTALKSGPNADYNAFLQRIIDDIQSGHGYHKDITPDMLIVAARTKYNNMVEDKSWGKVDPRDAKIMALITKLDQMEKARPNQPRSDAAANATNGGKTDSRFSTIEDWRKKFDGDVKTVEGKTFYWCKHHKSEEYGYNGLYVSSHSPENHDAWSKDKKNAKDGRFKPKNNPPAANSTDAKKEKDSAPKATLGLNDKLKQVLMTNVSLSADDVDKLFQQAQEN